MKNNDTLTVRALHDISRQTTWPHSPHPGTRPCSRGRDDSSEAWPMRHPSSTGTSACGRAPPDLDPSRWQCILGKNKNKMVDGMQRESVSPRINIFNSKALLHTQKAYLETESQKMDAVSCFVPIQCHHDLKPQLNMYTKITSYWLKYTTVTIPHLDKTKNKLLNNVKWNVFSIKL